MWSDCLKTITANTSTWVGLQLTLRIHVGRPLNAQPFHHAMECVGMDIEYRSGTARPAHQPTGLIQYPKDMLALNVLKRSRWSSTLLDLTFGRPAEKIIV